MINEKTFTAFFKIAPTPSLVLLPSGTKYTVLEVNNAYLKLTQTKREGLIGKELFETLHGDKMNPIVAFKKLKSSLAIVVKTKKSHKMAAQQQEVPIRGTSKFIVKYFEIENIPLLGEEGEVQLIVHTAVEVTKSVLSHKKIEESRVIIDKGLATLALTETISKLGRWELDLKTQIVLWSDGYNLVSGHKPQEFEMSVDKLSSIIHPDDLERVLQNYKNALIEQKDYKIEFRLINKNKSIHNVISRATFVYDKDGNLQKLVGVLQDVTDIKEAEEATKKTQKELQKILDLSLDIVCTVNGEGQFLMVSAACLSILGYSPEEMIGKPYSDFVYFEDLQKSQEAVNDIYLGNEVYNFENTYVRKDGTLVPMLWSGRWQESEKTLYGVGKDATNIKEDKKQVQERQAILEAALENLPIGIAINKVDDDKAIWMNKKYSQIYGWPESILKETTKALEKIYPDQAYRKMIIERVRNDIESGNKDLMHWDDLRITTQQGEEKNINIKRIPVYDQNLVISTVVDVTENRNAQIAIQESNERFEYVNKATFDAIWDWNLTTDTIYWGEGFESIFTHEIVSLERNSSSWTKNIHPEDLQRLTTSFYKVIKSPATNWIEEYRFKKGNGDYANVINKGVIVRDLNHRVTRIIGAMHDVTKQKQEEQRLKLLESVITNSTDAVLITEAAPFDYPETKIIFVNDAFTKMTGYSPDEVMGKTPRLLQGPKSDPEELKKLGAAIRRWESCEATLLNYKKNGEAFWTHLALSPVADATGWFTHWIAIEKDVTKIKQEEERLKLLEAVITNTTDAVVIKEAHASSALGRKIVYVNESFTRMTGYSESEIIGKTKKLLQGTHTDKKELARFHKNLDKQIACEITTLNYRKNGDAFWVNIASNPVFNVNGIHTHWISIEREVTERIKQEQKLGEVNQKLLDTLESIQDGFYTLDANWNITYWNSEAERLSGKNHQGMMGRNILEIYEGKIAKVIYNKFQEAKTQNKPIRIESHSKSLNKWFEINAFPSAMGLTVYFKDISERKTIESKLKKMNRKLEINVKQLAISNEELEQFAYVASHDLQEPLRMVTGFLTQIEKKYEAILDEKGKQYIYFAVDGAKRMRQIILDLLAFSRIGKNENTLEEINLNYLMAEIALLFGKQIKEKKAKINYENLPTLRSYSAPINQIFQNLISNSLKYSKINLPPVIQISSLETATAWKFVVQDNGIGIEAAYFDKIFVIFQRLHNKEEYSGTGIGLAITKKIIENLGGQIWVTSQVGGGTAFHFTIPKKQFKEA